MFVFRKIWRTLFCWNTRFEIRPFALLQTKLFSSSHEFTQLKLFFILGQLNAIMGVVQAIVRLPNGTLNADCDYRKGGKPAGF